MAVSDPSGVLPSNNTDIVPWIYKENPREQNSPTRWLDIMITMRMRQMSMGCALPRLW